jgi:hypothetical protein
MTWTLFLLLLGTAPILGVGLIIGAHRAVRRIARGQ